MIIVAAIREDGDWYLEAGALVLADGGICCIDEFNLMKTTETVSMHEGNEYKIQSFR
jgi:DNA helicase MCM9